MEIREAVESDSDQIRAIAEQSFQASYALSPLEIETIVEAEFGAESITACLDDDERILLVAEQDNSLLGFAEVETETDERGKIVWLHVDPTERGQGVGTELVEHAIADLRERAIEEIQAIVLTQNQEGSEFLEQFGFESVDQIDREFGEETFRAEIYTDLADERADEEYTVPESGEIEVEGQPRYIDPDESISGDEAPFLLVFEAERREERFGFYCTNCGSFTNSIDGNGKVVCENCGNVHNPDEWDRSYL